MTAIITSLIAGIFTLLAAWISRPSASQSPEKNLSKETPVNTPVATTTSASLILGIISFIAWYIPIFGFPVSLIGMALGVKDITNPSKKMARVGIWLNVVGLMATCANSAIGAYLGYKGLLQY